MAIAIRRPKTWILLSVALIALVVIMLPGTAAALPGYTTATGQPCATCHVNPAGGGALTATGQAFAAIPTHTTDPAGAFAQISRPAAAPTAAPAAAPTAPPAAATAAPAAATALPRTGDADYTALLAVLSAALILGGWGIRRLFIAR